MPEYRFKDKNTGKTWTEFMSISQRTELLEVSPHIEQLVHGFPRIVRGVNSFGHKKTLDTDFKSKLKAIKKANPGSTIQVP